MKFGPVPVAEAEGAILAHAMRAMDRPYEMQLDYLIPKGTVLNVDHLADLREEGHAVVTVARLDPDDIGEDAAATRLAGAIVPDPAAAHLRLTRAATGRVNLIAEARGIVKIDAAAIAQFNAVCPMITVATLAPLRRVAVGDLVATIKIISYGVAETDVARAADAAVSAIAVLPPVHIAACLIETRVTPDVPSDKGQRSLKMRLDRLGVWLSERQVVPHKVDALAAALAAADADVLFLLTGSATSDVADVGPSAVRAAGGEVAHFGMPVDPGNLLFIGVLNGKPVIGLPGCARSPALNGADWVLERVICGVQITSADIAAMGVGGLLKESPARGRPRRTRD